jgi:regulator of protease activity HflC (stomatin/prohibitin superfamily)
MHIGQYTVAGRAVGVAAAAVDVLVVGSNCYFTVDPSERAFVRLLGTPTTSVPYQPGPHFKWPFISQVDTLQVSQTSLPLKEFRVVTIDNQPVDLKVDIQFKIPDGDVARLLYDMGRTGAGDIDDPIRDVVQDRVYRVFSSKNTNTISANREPIQEEAQKFVGDALRNNFGIELVSLQIPQIAFSATFTESNALAVTAKNQAIREENQLKVVGYIADQRVREAQGRRDQQIAQAEGEARATELQATAEANATLTKTGAAAKSLLLQAEADRQAAGLRGSGDASARKAMVEASGGPALYVSILEAEARKNWGGAYPNVLSIGDKGVVPFLLDPALGRSVAAAADTK